MRTSDTGFLGRRSTLLLEICWTASHGSSSCPMTPAQVRAHPLLCQRCLHIAYLKENIHKVVMVHLVSGLETCNCCYYCYTLLFMLTPRRAFVWKIDAKSEQSVNAGAETSALFPSCYGVFVGACNLSLAFDTLRHLVNSMPTYTSALFLCFTGRMGHSHSHLIRPGQHGRQH
jgi:hypothetical protein